MVSDNEGFCIPMKDEAKCTSCNLCTLHCAQNANITTKKCIKVFGAKYINDKILFQSASGGVFTGLARKILESPEGIVFGCVFDDELVARHICISNLSDIEALQSSKYVQSDVGDTYQQAKQYLDTNRNVLFSGTPCQIAGLKCFLNKDYINLLTVDLICHGVPSPLLFKRYLNRISRKYNDKITHFNFRTKAKNGWGLMTLVKTSKKEKYIVPALDPYYSSFLDGKTYRECCYTCKYASSHSLADITIGDFWGVETAHPEFFDRKGVSAVLINTTKGEKAIESVKDSFYFIESTFDIVAKGNLNLRTPTPRPKIRDIIYTDINDESIDIFEKSYFKIRLRQYLFVYIKIFAKKILPVKVINAIKSRSFKQCKAD